MQKVLSKWRFYPQGQRSDNVFLLKHLKSLMLLRPTGKVEIHFQEKNCLTFDLGDKGHTKRCPLPSTACDLRTCKVKSTIV